jgi:hypothetical protein
VLKCCKRGMAFSMSREATRFVEVQMIGSGQEGAARYSHMKI